MECWAHLNLLTLLDLRVSSLRRGHANLLCIVPILTDDPRRESNGMLGPLLRGRLLEDLQAVPVDTLSAAHKYPNQLPRLC